MEVDRLVVALRRSLDEEERVALAASQSDYGSTPMGERWRWECTNCDTPIPITAVTVLDEFMQCPECESVGVALRSVEEYPPDSAHPLSHFVISGTEEQRPVDALHIVRHDPARVLRQVAAHRKLIDDFAAHEHVIADEYYGCAALRLSDEGHHVPSGLRCTCGRDEDVLRRLTLIAEIYGLQGTANGQVTEGA